MATICPNNSLYEPGHTFYYVLTYFWCNSIPLINQSIPQFVCPSGWIIVLAKLLFKMFSEVFNEVEVWGLCWPSLLGFGKSRPWETPDSRAELHRGTVETEFRGHRKYQQCRVRTWLQLMCCALILELGVLISDGGKNAE